MWEKENGLLIYRKFPTFFISITTKEFLKETSICQLENKKSYLPYLSTEKNLILFDFLERNEFLIRKTKLFLCEQVHKNKIIFLERGIEKDLMYDLVEIKNKKFYVFKEADGILTSLKDVAVVIFTADCIPLFVLSKNPDIFGLVHIGRRGLEEGICESLMLILKDKVLDLNSLYFIIGPHICGNCYKVDNKPYFLAEKVITTLLKHNVNKGNIFSSDYCTYHNLNPEFFSYRKDHTQMRNLSIIFLL